MLGEYYKVLRDFSPNAQECKENILPLEKGDIVVDVETVDAQWVTGRNMLSQQSGKIQRSFLAEFNGAEPQQGDKTKVEEKNCAQKQAGIQLTVNPLSNADEKSECAVAGVGTLNPQSGNFKSGCDEGYNSGNSCSNDSGERIVLMQTEPTVQEDKVVELPRRPPRQRPPPRDPKVKRTESFQDEDGYEIPILSEAAEQQLRDTRADSSASKKAKFTFDNNRKTSTTTEQRASPSSCHNCEIECGKAKLSPVGSQTFSDNYPRVTNSNLRVAFSSDHLEFTKLHRTKITLMLLLSSLLSLACFLIWILACGWRPLFSICMSLVVFVVALFAPFTMCHSRVLCVGVLILPSLFSRRTKSAIVVVICGLVLIGPVCNIARNLSTALDCHGGVVTEAANNNDSQPLNFSARAMTLFPYEHNKAAITNNSNASSSQQQSAMMRMNRTREYYNFCASSLLTLRDMCRVVRDELTNKCLSRMSRDKASPLPGNTAACSHAHAGCSDVNHIVAQCDASVGIHPGDDAASSDEWQGGLRSWILQLIPLLALVVLYDAYTYHREYLTNKSIDNVYVTRKLKVIDCERSKRGLTNALFPLRKAEFRRYVLPSSVRYTSLEWHALVYWLVIWVTACALSLCAIRLDDRIHAALDHAQLPCHGSLSGLSIHFRIATYVVLGLFLAAIAFSGHVLRMRSRICAMFYSRREISRIMHLYYTILDEREQFWGVHRRKVQLLAEARRLNARHDLVLHVHGSVPASIQRLWEKINVQRCMVCRSLACRKCFVCLDAECSAVFCYECYIDAGGACVACKQVNSGSSPCCEYVETR